MKLRPESDKYAMMFSWNTQNNIRLMNGKHATFNLACVVLRENLLRQNVRVNRFKSAVLQGGDNRIIPVRKTGESLAAFPLHLKILQWKLEV